MSKAITIKRGLDISIDGKAAETLGSVLLSDIISIVPDHYYGIVPKVLVREGERVLAGQAVFYSKECEAMKFVSPVSGTVLAVSRGERRKVLSIDIQCDTQTEYQKFDFKPLDELTDGEIKNLLLASGLWMYIKQRPYDVIANPEKSPKAVFISAWDSAPLAPDTEFVLRGQYADFQAGINALAKFATINLGIKAGSKTSELRAVKNAKITEYAGTHPAGNVGVQINKISPVNKGETVWTVGIQDVAVIGHFFNSKTVDLQRIIALTGTEVIEPKYYKTVAGASIESIVKYNVHAEIPLRYIAGNVLSGVKIEANDAVSPYATQLSVIAEGADTHEFAGWAMPRFDKFSTTNMFFTKILNNKFVKSILGKQRFDWDSRLLGGRRAIIMSGEYDRVFPFDILPEQLVKAMIARNIEKMENLGAYEIAPEDFALCEFVDTSKLPVQQIVRDALDYLRQEVE